MFQSVAPKRYSSSSVLHQLHESLLYSLRSELLSLPLLGASASAGTDTDTGADTGSTAGTSSATRGNLASPAQAHSDIIRMASLLIANWTFYRPYRYVAYRAPPSVLETAWKLGTHVMCVQAVSHAQSLANELARSAPMPAHPSGSSAALNYTFSSHSSASQAAAIAAEAVKTALQSLSRFMLRMASTQGTKQNITLLVEASLFGIRLGTIRTAYERIESLVSLHPFNEHSLLVGFAGLLCFLMWKQEQTTPENSRYFRLAQQHLEQSLAINASQDIFVHLLADIHVSAGNLDETRAILLDYERLYPGNPIAYQRRLRHLRDYPRETDANNSDDRETRSRTQRNRDVDDKDNVDADDLQDEAQQTVQEWVPLAEKLLSLDPLAEEQSALVPLIKHYSSIGARDDVVRVIADRLDYATGDTWLWKELVEHLDITPSTTAQWADRRYWWPSVHFGVDHVPTGRIALTEFQSHRLYQYIVAYRALDLNTHDSHSAFNWSLGFPFGLAKAQKLLLKKHKVSVAMFVGKGSHGAPDMGVPISDDEPVQAREESPSPPPPPVSETASASRKPKKRRQEPNSGFVVVKIEEGEGEGERQSRRAVRRRLDH